MSLFASILSDNAAQIGKGLCAGNGLAIKQDWCWSIHVQGHDLCFSLADLQSYLFTKLAETGSFLACVHTVFGPQVKNLRVCHTLRLLTAQENYWIFCGCKVLCSLKLLNLDLKDYFLLFVYVLYHFSLIQVEKQHPRLVQF